MEVKVLKPMILRIIRSEKGLTRKYVSHTAGVKLRTYISYETGERNPPLAVAAKIASALDCTIDDLLDKQDAN